MVKFGTAGLDANFTLQGFKKTIEAPIYMEKMGLDAFEYQCGRGVRVSDKMAAEFGAACKEKNITLSIEKVTFLLINHIFDTNYILY